MSASMLRTAVLAAVLCAAVALMASPPQAAAFPTGYSCGTGHPHVHEHKLEDIEVVDQTYHTTEHARDSDAAKRVLAEIHSESYAQKDGAFLPVSAADAAGIAAPIRIKVLWDVVEGGDYTGSKEGSNARQCVHVGDTIKVPCEFGGGGCLQTWDGCAAEDVVAVGHAKLALMKKRLAFVSSYYAKSLKLKPVQDDIAISSTVRSNYGVTTTTVSDADLVIIMTARPVPFQALAGYAQCVQQDQHGRCTVGVFNWVPKVLSVEEQDSPAQISSERHTALHEIIHVLGGIFPNGPFIDDNGNIRTTGIFVVERDSTAYNKPATKLITPKVLAVARDQFGCDSMTGVPLEDQPTGRGAHWEARIMGPEVMSYGTGTGVPYMSDLTFAYLEDTNQYIANYSMAGELVTQFGDTGGTQEFEVEATEEPKQHNVTVGMLRWGRHAGCSFVDGKATSWPDEYVCKVHKEFSCSFDHRMSAVCDIRSWSLPTNRQYTCGSFIGGSSRCEITLNDNCDSLNGCGIPTNLQPFDATTAKAAMGKAMDPGTLGGFSSAMDYVPQRLGYWSCQNTQPSNASAQLEREAGSVDLTAITANAEENMRLFGGQAYCPECRCFVSSLMDFTSGSLNPDFPRFGLCYRSNCFRPDYLQFAIQNQLGGVTWYKCPQEGGKMYIAGFSGAFHCPKAVDFCRFETISGIKYDETSPVWEWVLASVPFMLPVLFGVCLCCFGRCIDHAVAKVKHIVGVDFFENPSENDEDDREIPPAGPAYVLSGLNTLSGLFGFAVLGATLYAIGSGRVSEAAVTLLSFSIFVIFVSCLGGCGAFKRAYYASCPLLMYFYIVMFCAAVYFFFTAWAFFYTEAFNAWIARRWDIVVDALPADVLEKNLNHETAVDIVDANLGLVIGLGVAILLMLVIGITASVMIISPPVLMSSLFMMTNYSFVLTGLGVIGFGCYTAVFAAGLDTGVNMLIAAFICLGLYIVINSILGISGGLKRSPVLLKACFTMGFFSLVLQAVACGFLIVHQDALANMVDDLSDDEVSRYTSALGMAGLSAQDVKDTLTNNVRSFALALVCWLGTLILMLVSNVYVIMKLAADLEDELEAEGFQMRKTNRVYPESPTGSVYSLEDERGYGYA